MTIRLLVLGTVVCISKVFTTNCKCWTIHIYIHSGFTSVCNLLIFPLPRLCCSYDRLRKNCLDISKHIHFKYLPGCILVVVIFKSFPSGIPFVKVKFGAVLRVAADTIRKSPWLLIRIRTPRCLSIDPLQCVCMFGLAIHLEMAISLRREHPNSLLTIP